MARQASQTSRVLAAHDAMIAAQFEGRLVDRDALLREFMTRYGVGVMGAYNYIRAGTVLGCWEAEFPGSRGPVRIARLRILRREKPANVGGGPLGASS